MNNITIAKKLLKFAMELISSPTGTNQNFEQFGEEYKKQNKNEAYPTYWNLFNSEKQKRKFLKKKKELHPRLSEVVDSSTLDKLLKDGWFVIVSAGLNNEEGAKLAKEFGWEKEGDKINDIEGYINEAKHITKRRYRKLRRFLDELDCPYYEVLGQFKNDILKIETPELSYIVDLTNFGENDDSKAKSLLHKISSFCNQIKQTAIIEGIGGENIFHYLENDTFVQQLPGEGKNNDGRSTFRTDNKDYKKIVNKSFNYDWNNPKPINNP